MNNMLLDIPVANEYWYIYDLLLIFVIAVLIFIIMLLKKRSNLKEAERNFKSALSLIKRIKGFTNLNKLRIGLYTVKNLLRSSVYSFNLCISENDMYHLTDRVNCINSALETLDELIKKTTDIEEIKQKLAVLGDNLGNCV